VAKTEQSILRVELQKEKLHLLIQKLPMNPGKNPHRQILLLVKHRNKIPPPPPPQNPHQQQLGPKDDAKVYGIWN
jgi:hypothetical protein